MARGGNRDSVAYVSEVREIVSLTAADVDKFLRQRHAAFGIDAYPLKVKSGIEDPADILLACRNHHLIADWGEVTERREEEEEEEEVEVETDVVWE